MGDKYLVQLLLLREPAPHLPPFIRITVHQFGQHFQYVTACVWENTHVKRDYPVI